MLDPCTICSSPADRQSEPGGKDALRINCSRCGAFRTTRTFGSTLESYRRKKEFTAAQIANISGYLRENQRQLWDSQDLELLTSLRTPSARGKATKLMRFIRARHPSGGIQFDLPYHTVEHVLIAIDRDRDKPGYPSGEQSFTRACQAILPYVGAAWSEDAGDFLFTFNEYVRKQERWIERSSEEIGTARFRITPEGWNFLDSLDAPSPDSKIGFVAMWFDDETSKAWKEGIEPGIRDAGYQPLRIDLHEHDNRIDDEIIARIRSSKFILADLTGNRGGVYWEAGFAFGLGRKVIWSVKSDHLKYVHFDVRQFPFIIWEPEKLPDFRSAITHRVTARLGFGPGA